MADIKVFHIVRAFHVVVNHAFTCAAKSLDGINLSLLQRGAQKQSLLILTKASKTIRVSIREKTESHNYLTSILVASPPLTMGTVFPACILYCPIEWPFKFLIGFTAKQEVMQTFKDLYKSDMRGLSCCILNVLSIMCLKSNMNMKPNNAHHKRSCSPYNVYLVSSSAHAGGKSPDHSKPVFLCSLGDSSEFIWIPANLHNVLVCFHIFILAAMVQSASVFFS